MVAQLVSALCEDRITVTEALDELAALSARQARVVELRYFGGHTMREVAEMLGVSLSTAEKDFDKAIAFLNRRVQEASRP